MLVRPFRCSTLLVVAAGFCFAAAPSSAAAQSFIAPSFAPGPEDCSDVRWSDVVLRVFPSIAEACQAVGQRNGKSYVKLEGTVVEVSGGFKKVRVDFKDGRELTFVPTPRTALYIEGRRTQFAELAEGRKLDFHVPEDRLQAELRMDPAKLAFIIVPIDLPETWTAGDRSSEGQPSGAHGEPAGMDQSSRTDRTAVVAGEPVQRPVPVEQRVPTIRRLFWIAGTFLIVLAATAVLIRKLSAR